ncbi:MAG: hypothetical protein U5K84_09950 [Alkalibacterium sp.]|nr:hypothetical protein [Alkalibacterium sp.]
MPSSSLQGSTTSTCTLTSETLTRKIIRCWAISVICWANWRPKTMMKPRSETEIDTHTGGIHGNVAVYEDKEGNIKPYFKVSGKALAASWEDLTGLMKEYLLASVRQQGENC